MEVLTELRSLLNFVSWGIELFWKSFFWNLDAHIQYTSCLDIHGTILDLVQSDSKYSILFNKLESSDKGWANL